MAGENLPPPSDDDPSTQVYPSDDGAISIPDSGDAGEGGKLKMIVQLVKRCLGVKDIAAMRLSLPASLLEPLPNLEYWQYVDRPDLFAAINDSDDAFERMLAVIRFTFTKDLKFVRGKVCKPYNSVLGEHFRSHWDVIPVTYPSDPLEPPIHHVYLTTPAESSTRTSESASLKSTKSATLTSPSSRNLTSSSKKNLTSPSNKTLPLAHQAHSVESNERAGVSVLSLAVVGEAEEGELLEAAGEPDAQRVRVVFLTEQVSHHPPISSFHIACPARGLEAGGVDQLSAKVSGTTVRVSTGTFNKGIFIHIKEGYGKKELYRITHPVAYVNGILRGSFYVTISESTIITCSGGSPGEKLRAIIEYKEESWLGKPHFAIEGVIHAYKEGETAHEEWTRVKHVPRARVLAVFDGSWRHAVQWKRAQPDAEYTMLLDLSQLLVVPKSVRPISKQLPTESRRLWENVTKRLLTKEFNEATKHKLLIEQRQRELAAERHRKGEEFIPVYFEKDLQSGFPQLSEAGRQAIEEELKEVDDPESGSRI